MRGHCILSHGFESGPDATKVTALADVAERERLWNGGAAAIEASDDPFIRLARAVDAPARAVRQRQESEVASIESRAATQIAKVRFEKLGTTVYPDATFTLRLSYGDIAGWEENGNIWCRKSSRLAKQLRTPFVELELSVSWLQRKKNVKFSLMTGILMLYLLVNKIHGLMV